MIKSNNKKKSKDNTTQAKQAMTREAKEQDKRIRNNKSIKRNKKA